MRRVLAAAWLTQAHMAELHAKAAAANLKPM